MLFRMISLEQMPMKGLERKVRQLFVTQSRVLAGRVNEYFAQLLRSLDTADLSIDQIKATKRDNKRDLHVDLVDLDDDYQAKADLPARFSDLEDRHFPLFLSFEQVRDHMLAVRFGVAVSHYSRIALLSPQRRL